MNSQQTAFVIAVTQGLSQVDAYLAAFPKASRASARSAAARLIKRPDIQSEITRLRVTAEQSAVMSLQEKREWLAEVIRGPATDTPKVADQLRAVEVDSKLAGDYHADRPENRQNPFAFIVAFADRTTLGRFEKDITPEIES